VTPARAESRGSLVVAAQVVCIVDDDSVRQALDGLVRSAGLQAAAFALEYANQFQHDTNPGTFETVAINDAELKGFVTRAVTFARR
jgi:FixJ family two-component response regulator